MSIFRTAILAGALAGSAGCYYIRAMTPPDVRFDEGMSASPSGPVDANRVAVYHENSPLPDGFAKDRDGGIVVEKDYPNKDAPSLVIGYVRVKGEPRTHVPDHEELLAMVTAEAGKHGANAVVMPRCSNVPVDCSVTALYLSSARSQQQFAPATELLSAAPPPPETPKNAKRTDVTGDLGDGKLSVEAAAGTCYALTIALDATSQLSAEARKAFSIRVRQGGKTIFTGKLGEDIPRSKRTFTTKVGCAKSDDAMEVSLLGSQGRGGAQAPAGRGAVIVAVHAWRQDGEALDDAGDPQALKTACASGNALSCYQLGELYEQGLGGVRLDAARSALLYTLACEGGHGVACFNMARQYDTGRGVAQDYARAALFYGKACDITKGLGCSRVAFMYQEGRGVPRDDKRAAALYTKACDADDPRGCTGIALLMQEGSGVPKDDKHAAAYFEKACNGKGEELACVMYGALLEEGKGVAKDPARAATFYGKGCDAGQDAGCMNLGIMLFNGRSGFPKDEKRGLPLIEKACEGRLPRACYSLGLALEQGPSRDPVRAAAAHAKGCALGDKRSCAKAKKP